MIRLFDSEKEIEDSYNLFSYVFGGENEKIHRSDYPYYIEKSKETMNYGIFEKNQLVSQLVNYPFTTHWSKGNLKAGGVGDVATHPLARKKGYIKKLFQYMFEDLYQKGIVLSYLSPFSHKFYRQFGYETLILGDTIEVPAKKIAEIKAKNNLKIRLSNLLEGDITDSLDDIYDQTWGKSSGVLCRTPWWWHYYGVKFPKREVALFFNDDDQIQGYLIFQQDIKKGNLYIHELAGISKEFYESALFFIQGYLSKYEWVIFKEIYHPDILNLWSDPRFFYLRQREREMVRVINFEAFIKNFKWKDTNATFSLRIVDKDCPWNAGDYSCKLISGELYMEKGPLAEIDVTMDIRRVVQWLTGKITAENLLFLGEITGNKEHVLKVDKLVHKESITFIDHF